MGKTFYIIAITLLSITLLSLVIALFIVRARANERQENTNPYCPIAVCDDGELAQPAKAD